MITGISIENFKGIGERVELDLRPITLLFGANSAGKSSLLHALQYAAEILERRNLNPDRTLAGGAAVDLGGFLNLVHGHHRDGQVRLALSLNLTAADLDNCHFAGIYDDESALDDFCYEVNQADVAFTIGWDIARNQPQINRYEVSINGEPFGTIATEPGRPETVLQFNPHHSVFYHGNEVPDMSRRYSTEHPYLILPSDPLEQLEPHETFLAVLWDYLVANHRIEGQVKATNPMWRANYLDQRFDAFPALTHPLAMPTDRESRQQFSALDQEHLRAVWAVESVVLLLSRLMIGPARVARESLRQFRYLGPVRETPPRNYAPAHSPDPLQWATGLGAWDALHTGSDNFVEQVGRWLGDADCLNAGCRLERRKYLELDTAHPLVRKLIDGRAFDDIDADASLNLSKLPTVSRVVVVPDNAEIELRPHDVGVGISQVVPVIVTALDGQNRLLAIEQPELHVHPRLQAALGDLFIEAAQGQGQRFIIETHSEHLVLRLLRRIRETEQGQAPPNRELRTHDLAIYFLQQDQGATRAQRIDVDVKGEFIQPWPDDFFEIDFQERFA